MITHPKTGIKSIDILECIQTTWAASPTAGVNTFPSGGHVA